jgi:hypothetical protein
MQPKVISFKTVEGKVLMAPVERIFVKLRDLTDEFSCSEVRIIGFEEIHYLNAEETAHVVNCLFDFKGPSSELVSAYKSFPE